MQLLIKKIISCVIALVTVVGMNISAKAASTEVNVTWTQVHIVYAGPTVPSIHSQMNDSSNVIAYLNNVDTIYVMGNTGQIDWLRYKYNGQVGFIRTQWIGFTTNTFYKTYFNGKVLKRGFTGQAVWNLQLLMKKKCGYTTLGYDGIFGSETEKKVIEYQKIKGLTQDGMVGKNTAGKILDDFEEP